MLIVSGQCLGWRILSSWHFLNVERERNYVTLSTGTVLGNLHLLWIQFVFKNIFKTPSKNKLVCKSWETKMTEVHSFTPRNLQFRRWGRRTLVVMLHKQAEQDYYAGALRRSTMLNLSWRVMSISTGHGKDVCGGVLGMTPQGGDIHLGFSITNAEA